VAYGAAALGLPVLLRFLREAAFCRANYESQMIPSGAGLGLVLLLPALLALGLLAGVPGLTAPLCLIFAFALTGFGLAGLVDDCLGTGGDKGFRGHFSALLREGRLTSGALKALFGATVAFLTSLALTTVDDKTFGPWPLVLLHAVLLASSANLLNLFDLRPGRAGKVFFFGLLLCAALARKIEHYGAPLPSAAAVFIPFFRRDLRAQLMLGDTGANFLGAALGMAMVLWLTPHAKVVAAVLLLGLQVLSERYSFNALIERLAILRMLDRWGRGAGR